MVVSKIFTKAMYHSTFSCVKNVLIGYFHVNFVGNDCLKNSFFMLAQIDQIVEQIGDFSCNIAYSHGLES